MSAEEEMDAAAEQRLGVSSPDCAESRVALIDSATGRRVTYAELRRSIRMLATGLYHGLGIRKGDVVFLLAPNSLLYPTICLAVLSIGAVLTTANPLNTQSEISKQVDDSGAKVAISAPEELHNDPALDLPPAQMSQSDTAAILYSSGTTGTSKGVILTHAKFIAMMTLLKWNYHCRDAKVDSKAMLDAIQAYQVSNIPAVPPVILGLVKNSSSCDLSSLRRVGSGAAPLSKEVAEGFREKFPWVELRTGYGLTESCGAATYFVTDEQAKARAGSSGRLLPRFVPRWWILKQGWLYHLIGGRAVAEESYCDERVAPAELEAILLSHPSVLDAAVIPVEDEAAGQIPMAYVVRAGGSELTQQEVIQFVAARWHHIEIRKVGFINAIPRSTAGKSCGSSSSF
ncbi:4-coumarate--CoA ligase-like 5 [Vitis vinifera]|uniref:4-coumarate--CoA ligase-like 5 n=1 Tax=Vitis vinifera TaxID=29760 RepID=A0A438ILM4_VITVI|nr:4-coumarate--CoA ligase-like 5 [Vitis vinifera]